MPTANKPAGWPGSAVDDAMRALLEDQNAPAVFIPFNYSSNAAEARCKVKAGASYLFGFTVSNANVAARFIQVFDTDAFPANGAVPAVVVVCATVADKEMLWYPPRRMDRGIVLAASTTQNTLTLAGADHVFDVQYI